jgi:acyl carrier protein
MKSLHDRLVEFIEEAGVDLDGQPLKEDTSLIRSGLFDSLALLHLVTWIGEECDLEVDQTRFDPSQEWDTIADILRFIEKHKGSQTRPDAGR